MYFSLNWPQGNSCDYRAGLESYSFVQTKNSAIVQQLRRLWNWLNYSAHDFRRDSAHYMACSFSIVKPGAKVITIEPSADALSVEESLTL
jgi:hypothetical protein